MTDFIDPPNKEDILRQLNSLKTSDDTNRFVEHHFPGWLVVSLPEYSRDYPHLQNNWEKIYNECKNIQPWMINWPMNAQDNTNWNVFGLY
jgi:hypothetical protein